MEVDCRFASKETADLPLSEQTLEPGCAGLISYGFEPNRVENPIPSPWKAGMAVELYLPYGRANKMPDFCGGRKYKDLLPGRVSVGVYGSGGKLLKRIPGTELPDTLSMW